MEHILRLGEGVVIGRGWLARQRVFFTGAVSKEVFSVAVEWTNVHNSASYNIYFHESQSRFSLLHGRMTVLSVTRDELRFRFDR